VFFKKSGMLISTGFTVLSGWRGFWMPLSGAVVVCVVLFVRVVVPAAEVCNPFVVAVGRPIPAVAVVVGRAAVC
jgi:hypothetical protein